MFFNFGVIDIIDIIVVAILFFYIYKLMKNSSSLNVFVGIIFFVIAWLLVRALQMRLMKAIMDQMVSVGILALIVIFQSEIRNFFYNIGSSQRTGLLKFITKANGKKEANKEHVMAIVMACLNMSKKKTGALIVIEKHNHLEEVINSGETINADINQRLIENIFFKNSPLHDGAMVIRNGKIMAAGCILPVSHDQDIPKDLGLRHRSALGIAQKSDAISVIVSEETGKISVAQNGAFQLQLTAEELESLLTKEM